MKARQASESRATVGRRRRKRYMRMQDGLGV